MGMGPADGDPERLAREDVRRSGTAPHEGGAARGEPAVGALRPPEPEFDDRRVARGADDPRCLRRHERGEVDRVEDRRFDDLRLEQAALDAEQRLEWEYRGAFRN